MSKSYIRKWIHKGGIIRQRGNAYQVEINFNLRRIRETCESLVAAKFRIGQKMIELRNEGSDSQDLTPEQRSEAAQAIKALPPDTRLHDAIRQYAMAAGKLHDTPLASAIDFYLSHHSPVGGITPVRGGGPRRETRWRKWRQPR